MMKHFITIDIVKKFVGHFGINPNQLKINRKMFCSTWYIFFVMNNLSNKTDNFEAGVVKHFLKTFYHFFFNGWWL